MSCVIAKREGNGCTVLVRDVVEGHNKALQQSFGKHGEVCEVRVQDGVGGFVTFRDRGTAERAQALVNKMSWKDVGLDEPQEEIAVEGGLARSNSAEAA